MSDSRPWLTIVTVVRNDGKGLSRTLASLATAELDGVEVLVVDGSDHPATMQGVADEAKVPSVQLIWDEPRGIYPAMNVGLNAARGAYIYYLNAGDTLHAPGAISDIRAALMGDGGAVWLVGRVRFTDASGHAVAPSLMDFAHEKSRAFAGGVFPPHQGTICLAQIARDLGGFDESYTIAADYALMLRLSQTADPVLLDTVLADFELGGASTVNWARSIREFHRARREGLALSGGQAVAEWLRTAWQFTKLAAYHWVVQPIRERSRRSVASP